MYDEVESVCLFMGYTRSGHSLVGTILDAHPQAVIAHERAVFKVDRGDTIDGHPLFDSRDEMFGAFVAASQRSSKYGKRGYRRTEPNRLIGGASNGEYTTLRVLGTKRGQETPLAWKANPQVFDDLFEMTGVPVKLLHVYRNPWDNISSMTRAIAPG